MNSPLYNLPAATPPPGVSPNFVDPPTQQPAIEALDCVFVSLMLLTVFMRIYVRSRITKIWELDDYACVIAAMGSVAHMINYFELYKIGYGRHLWDFRASTLLNDRNTRLLSVNGITYPFTIFFAKLSVLLLYLRIFDVYTGIRYAVYFGIVFQALFYTSMIAVAIRSMIICTATADLTNTFCANYAGPVVILNASFNAASDFYVLLLPIHRMFKLNMSWRLKVGLLVVFLSGVAACAASLARLIMFSVKNNSSDVLWDEATNAKFTIVEMNIAIIVACAGCFLPFFRQLRDTSLSVYHYLLSRSRSSSRSSTTLLERKRKVVVREMESVSMALPPFANSDADCERQQQQEVGADYRYDDWLPKGTVETTVEKAKQSGSDSGTTSN